MYRLILFISFSLSTVLSFAQINFEKGYFINNEGKKTECFIKNSDWVKNPTKFDYRINLSDENSEGNISFIKEFGITNFSKYIRATVDIDRSKPMQNSVSDVSDKVEPDWKNETLFLKVLKEGKGNLYYYEDELMNRFFYKVDNSTIQQLIYKEYSIDGHNLKLNKQFQEQLQQNLNCEKTADVIFSKIGYSKNELEKHFTKFNSCFVSNEFNESKSLNKSKGVFRIKPLIGIASSTIKGFYTPNYYYKDPMFSKSVSNLRVGFELEYIMEFNKNKWALLFETVYESTKATERYKAQSLNYGIVDFGDGESEFNTLEFGIGARHYMYVAKSASLFLNLVAYSKTDLKSYVKINNQYSKEFNKGIGIATGFGARVSNFSAEIRYRFSNSLITTYNNNYFAITETYKDNQLNFLLTYTLFQIKK